MLPLGMRLHSKRLPSGSNIIRYEFTDRTNWQEKYRATWMLRIGFMLPLGMRLHSKRLPSGSNIIRYEFTDRTNWQEKYRATWMLRIEIY